MLKKTLVMAVAVAALVLATTSPASAQAARQYLVTGGIGYSKLFDLEIERINDVDNGAENPTPDGSIAVSASAFYTGTQYVAVGGEVSWLYFGSQDIGGVDDSYTAIPITGQVLYLMPMEGSTVTPFFTGGAGLYHLRNKQEGDNDEVTYTSNVFGFNLGGGIKMETDMEVSFGVDVRYHYAIAPDLTGDTPTGERSVETTDWNMISVMAKVFY